MHLPSAGVEIRGPGSSGNEVLVSGSIHRSVVRAERRVAMAARVGVDGGPPALREEERRGITQNKTQAPAQINTRLSAFIGAYTPVLGGIGRPDAAPINTPPHHHHHHLCARPDPCERLEGLITGSAIHTAGQGLALRRVLHFTAPCSPSKQSQRYLAPFLSKQRR